jgi:hypothetical protein
MSQPTDEQILKLYQDLGITETVTPQYQTLAELERAYFTPRPEKGMSTSDGFIPAPWYRDGRNAKLR